ncbi:lipopolysaccharide biosynthesis protein [Pseudoalteromonas sp. SG45-2]|nr:lipopolysaccharide biosynthesis protein [Pseudoalteromonas sp. SG45-2]
MSFLTQGELGRALIKSMTGRYALYAVQMLSLMILARVFTPELFGIFAVIQVFATFFILFSEMGFGPALINQKEIPNGVRDGIFSVTAIIGVFIAASFLLLSPLISSFYENEIYNLLVIPVAVSVLFNTVSIVPLAILQREQKFILVAGSDIAGEITSVIVVFVLLAFVHPIFALSSKPLTISIIRCFFLWYLSGTCLIGKPQFGRQFYHVKKLLSFSAFQLGFNIMNYFSRSLDNILVGKYLGVSSLGIYDKAYQLMRYPLMLLTFAMTPAIQPVLTKLKNDKSEFERLHNQLVNYLAIAGLVAGISIYFLADFIVLILLGEQWEGVSNILKLLSVTIPIQMMLSSSGGFFQAAGRADLLFYCGVFSSVVNVIAIILGIYFGSLESLCIALIISFSINFIQCYTVLSIYILPRGLSGLVKKVWWILIINIIFISFAIMEFFNVTYI